MIIDTVLVGVTAEFLVSSINGLVASNPSLSAEWVGLILLPIVSATHQRRCAPRSKSCALTPRQVGNAAEHFTAVSVSVKDKLDLSISVAVGSSIQIALFVIPVIQLLAWTIGKPMTLLFDREWCRGVVAVWPGCPRRLFHPVRVQNPNEQDRS
jgi:Ca2+:H+ antiporter